jgi:hypothetical protein
MQRQTLAECSSFRHPVDVSQSAEGARVQSPTVSRLIVPGVGVVRNGRAEPFLETRPTLSSAPVQRGGIALRSRLNVDDANYAGRI